MIHWLLLLATTGEGGGPITPDPLFSWLKDNATAVGMLAFIVACLMRGWLVTGREAAALRQERDRAMELVYKQAEITQRALEASERRGP